MDDHAWILRSEFSSGDYIHWNKHTNGETIGSSNIQTTSSVVKTNTNHDFMGIKWGY